MQPAEVETSKDPAALREEIAKLQAEKATAVAGENFSEAERLKTLIASKEAQLKVRPGGVGRGHYWTEQLPGAKRYRTERTWADRADGWVVG